MKKRVAIIAGVLLAVGSSVFGGSAAQAAPPAACNDNAGTPIPVIYTDGLNHYVAVCVDGAPDGLTYVQVDELRGLAEGRNPLLELGIGIGEVDTLLGSNGLSSIPSPSTAGCNPDYYGPGTDNVIDLGVARVYTDGANHYIGACNEYGTVQVEQLDHWYQPDPSNPPITLPVP